MQPRQRQASAAPTPQAPQRVAHKEELPARALDHARRSPPRFFRSGRDQPQQRCAAGAPERAVGNQRRPLQRARRSTGHECARRPREHLCEAERRSREGVGRGAALEIRGRPAQARQCEHEAQKPMNESECRCANGMGPELVSGYGHDWSDAPMQGLPTGEATPAALPASGPRIVRRSPLFTASVHSFSQSAEAVPRLRPMALLWRSI